SESGHSLERLGCPLCAKSGHSCLCQLAGLKPTNAAERGRMTLISVNAPGCVSTSIEPACCTTMSWQIRSRGRRSVTLSDTLAIGASPRHRGDDAMHTFDYIPIGFLIACMLLAAAKALPRRNQ